MDFALKILGKYGWKEGEGLGKNSHGIVKPLKATLKFDNAGFGSDQAAADFNNHWWERVYNEASSNVDVQQKGEQIKMDLKDADDSVEISTKGYSMKKLKKAKRQREQDSVNGYDNFLRAATLTNLGGEIENPNKIDASDIEVTKIKVLTDEELFKACGGRTAHKGARHGLKLNGKLSRIEQQEQELLEKMMAKRNATEEANRRSMKVTLKNKLKLEEVDNVEQNEAEGTIKKKKKSRTLEKIEEPEVADECTTENILNNKEKKKKKKRKIEEQDNFEETAKSIEGLENITRKKKKKCVSELETETSVEQLTMEAKLKRKKNRKETKLEQSFQDAEHKKSKSDKKNSKEAQLTQELDVDIVRKKNKSKKKLKDQKLGNNE